MLFPLTLPPVFDIGSRDTLQPQASTSQQPASNQVLSPPSLLAIANRHHHQDNVVDPLQRRRFPQRGSVRLLSAFFPKLVADPELRFEISTDVISKHSYSTIHTRARSSSAKHHPPPPPTLPPRKRVPTATVHCTTATATRNRQRANLLGPPECRTGSHPPSPSLVSSTSTTLECLTPRKLLRKTKDCLLPRSRLIL